MPFGYLLTKILSSFKKIALKALIYKLTFMIHPLKWKQN